MALMQSLKYPHCEVCKLLDSINVDIKQINDYHEDKIPLSKLPKQAQKFLRGYLKKLGGETDGR